MDCQDIQIRIPDYLDGWLSRAERDLVKTHLLECPFCNAALAKSDPLAAVLLRAVDPIVPQDLADIIVAAARRQVSREQPVSWSLLSWWRLSPVSMQAAAIGMLVFGLSLGCMLGRSVATSPEAVSTTMTQAEPIDIYQLDYLEEAPSGSLADSYLALIMASNGEGQ